MEMLKENDFKVLVRIERRMLGNNEKRINEFSELKEKEITESLGRLSLLGLIFEDKGVWTLTFDGQKMLQKRRPVVEDYYSRFLNA